ncbi:MAG: TGS domain-containing protein, partial [Acidimicrobiia bacterium]
MSDQVTVALPDGSTRDYPAGVTPAEVAASIGRRLAEAAVAARVDGNLVDLDRPLDGEVELAVVTAESPEGLEILRHSTSHVLAQAVLDLFPGARYAIGPPIADGFYYDFELPGGAHFSEADLERIEARMREIVAEDQHFVREELDRRAGLELFADQPYKQEIIEGAETSEGAAGGAVSVYRNNSFVDLC